MFDIKSLRAKPFIAFGFTTHRYTHFVIQIFYQFHITMTKQHTNMTAKKTASILQIKYSWTSHYNTLEIFPFVDNIYPFYRMAMRNKFVVCTFLKVLQWQTWKCKTISTWKLWMENLNCENKICFHCSKMLAITIKIKFTGNGNWIEQNLDIVMCLIHKNHLPSGRYSMFSKFFFLLTIGALRICCFLLLQS